MNRNQSHCNNKKYHKRIEIKIPLIRIRRNKIIPNNQYNTQADTAIANKENIVLNNEVIDEIIIMSYNDYRNILNILQFCKGSNIDNIINIEYINKVLKEHNLSFNDFVSSQLVDIMKILYTNMKKRFFSEKALEVRRMQQ